jgi:beta-glucosidase
MMKQQLTKYILTPLFLINFIYSIGQDNIDLLIDGMSVEQKVGQMTQINLGFLSSSVDQHDGKVKQIDNGKLKSAIEQYHVGSILNTAGTAYSIEKWHKILTKIQDIALATPLKIPVLYGIDAIHGVTYTKGSTLFPHNIGLAATRNPVIANQIAVATAKETRASGLRWNFDPVIDVGRNPLWPRFCETFGEDPFLVSTLGAELIKGYEQDGLSQSTAVASCMKHFIGYSDPKSGKDRTEAYISDITLWQKHIPSFKAAIDAGASTIMINSSMINDVPVHGSYKLLTQLLRNKLGFKGMIVTDWEDIIRLHERHKIAETPREAVRIAIEAGIDMSMVPNSFSFCEHLIDLVKSGDVSEERIDASVRRILVLKRDLGLFENAYPEKDALQNFGLQEYQSLALNSARESMVLLKNQNNVLPLSKNKKYLLLGPGANCLSALNGCWSYSWQGDNEEVYPKTSKTILDVFQERFSANQVLCDVKSEYSNVTNFNINFSDEEISNVDYVILFLGENAYAESPGNIDDLTLDPNQIDLAKRAIALDKKIVLVLIQGRPRIINDFSENIDGIINAFLPGSMGAQAIVDVLFGDFNPSGTLPFTYPAHSGDLLTYDHKNLSAMVRTAPNKKIYGGYHPAFKFGEGLSYSDFSISNFKLNADTIAADEKLQISFQLKNNSELDGTKNIDVFINDHYASLAPDVKNLKDFTKVFLKGGAQKEVRMELDRDDLFFFNAKGEKLLEEGSFSVFIGDQKATFYLKN